MPNVLGLVPYICLTIEEEINALVEKLSQPKMLFELREIKYSAPLSLSFSVQNIIS
jgi:hypothetical protein